MKRQQKNFGQFVGDVITVWNADHLCYMTLQKPFTYYDSAGIKWTADAGEVINGASTGWFFRRLFPAFVGRYRRATVLHDVYCVKRIRPSWAVHLMFYQAMRCDGTGPFQAYLLWIAVRLFGPRFKGKRIIQ